MQQEEVESIEKGGDGQPEKRSRKDEEKPSVAQCRPRTVRVSYRRCYIKNLGALGSSPALAAH